VPEHPVYAAQSLRRAFRGGALRYGAQRLTQVHRRAHAGAYDLDADPTESHNLAREHLATAAHCESADCAEAEPRRLARPHAARLPPGQG
jgi:hypothetical protein